MCSLKVLEVEGSPSRSLLRLMGDRGCTVGDLVEFLKMMGHTEAIQCLKSGTVHLFLILFIDYLYNHFILVQGSEGRTPVQHRAAHTDPRTHTVGSASQKFGHKKN